MKKSLGQNFLIDHNIARKIANLLNHYSSYNLIEVGPGKGFLTDYLIKQKPKKIFLIEKDKNLFKDLVKKYESKKNIKIFNEDALKSNLIFEVPQPKIIVSNLPYNISVKLITNWLPQIDQFISFKLMIQKEVAERFKYTNKTKNNRLNLFAYLLSDYKIEFNVSNNVFFPKPKVQSSVVSFKPNKKTNLSSKNFSEFTKILFFSKRKKIVNNLNKNSNFKKKIKDNQSKVDLSKRPEELSFQEIVKLYSFLM